MNQKVMLLLGLVVPLVVAGCNANPVAVPKDGDTPLLFQQTAISQSSKIDLLWMIDNSGSMAEEQTAIASQLPGLAQALSLVDFRLAVTSTGGNVISAKNCKGVAPGTCKPGQFRNKAWIHLSPAGVYTVDKIQGIFYAAFDNCLNSLYDKDGIKDLKTNFEIKITGLGGKDKVNELLADDSSAGSVITALNSLIPNGGNDFREVGPVLSFSSYDKDPSGKRLSSSGLEQLQKDLVCLSLVGTSGSGIEEGLAAVVKAVDKDGPNKADPLILTERAGAKLFLLLVSDENDCSHEVIKDWNGKKGERRDLSTNCVAATCNLFNTYGYDDKKNPLRSPKSLYEAFLNNLSSAKGSTYNQDLVYAFAITGTALPQPLQTSGGFTKKAADEAMKAGIPVEQINCEGETCTITNKTIAPVGKDPVGGGSFSPNVIDKWRTVWSINGSVVNTDEALLCKTKGQKTTPESVIQQEMVACTSALGTSVSGDRYYRFIKGFEHRYPKNSGEVGAMCGADFSSVFQTLVGLVSGGSGECLQQRLLPCEEGAKSGDSCGPEGSGGVCTSYEKSNNLQQFKGLFCSAAVQPRLVCSNKSSFDTLKGALCRTGSESDSSCLVKEELYKLDKACVGGVGVQFAFVDPNNKTKINDSGCSLDLDFTAFQQDAESANN